MISKFTKIQLIVFAFVTVIGGAIVGGKYAEIDRLFIDRTYPVVAQFSDSGGIFAGAEVTYRGIAIGKVGKLTFTESGVNARIDVEDSAPKISEDVVAVVANKSAIGEQFVDLQPRTNSAPYLKSGSVISLANTKIPISTTTLLIDIDNLVASIDTDSLRTLVDELGMAFDGTGRDLTRIIDTSSEFIQTADDNIDVTRDIIRSSSTVLQTQIDKQGQLATFSRNLALLSDTFVDSDPDIRRLFDEGTSSAKLLDEVVDENADDLTSIFRDLRTATVPIDRLSKSVEVISILYPYLVEGGFSTISPSQLEGDEGEFDATFGLVFPNPAPPEEGGDPPEAMVCDFDDGGRAAERYRERREPNDLQDIPFNVDTDCKDYAKVARNPEKTIVNLNRSGMASAPREESWKWLLLGPATN